MKDRRWKMGWQIADGRWTMADDDGGRCRLEVGGWRKWEGEEGRKLEGALEIRLLFRLGLAAAEYRSRDRLHSSRHVYLS